MSTDQQHIPEPDAFVPKHRPKPPAACLIQGDYVPRENTGRRHRRRNTGNAYKGSEAGPQTSREHRQRKPQAPQVHSNSILDFFIVRGSFLVSSRPLTLATNKCSQAGESQPHTSRQDRPHRTPAPVSTAGSSRDGGVVVPRKPLEVRIWEPCVGLAVAAVLTR